MSCLPGAHVWLSAVIKPSALDGLDASSPTGSTPRLSGSCRHECWPYSSETSNERSVPEHRSPPPDWSASARNTTAGSGETRDNAAPSACCVSRRLLTATAGSSGLRSARAAGATCHRVVVGVRLGPQRGRCLPRPDRRSTSPANPTVPVRVHARSQHPPPEGAGVRQRGPGPASRGRDLQAAVPSPAPETSR